MNFRLNGLTGLNANCHKKIISRKLDQQLYIPFQYLNNKDDESMKVT